MIPKSSNWTCLSCMDHPEFSHADVIKHLRNTHNTSIMTGKGGHEKATRRVEGEDVAVYEIWVISGVRLRRKILYDCEQFVKNHQLQEKLAKERKPVDNYMPFGEFKGQRLDQVPAWYLHFVFTNFDRKRHNEIIFQYIIRNINVLKMEHPDGIWEMKQPEKKETNGRVIRTDQSKEQVC